MNEPISFSDFCAYAEGYTPFRWELGDQSDFLPEDVRGKHSVLVSLVRFWLVANAVRKASPDFSTIVDVGAYPGAMIKILRHYFPQAFEYWAVGLGMSEEYRTEMQKLGGTCFETEIDPGFVAPAPAHAWPVRNADCVLLLDVIEHLVNPVDCLDAINKALRDDGILVITTDNIASFANAYQMAKNGRSPNLQPLHSSLIYRGPWRPHFREFSKDELAFYLDHAGFSVVEHRYFERRQGDYFFDANGKVGVHNRYRGLKGGLQRAILSVAPHLQDHQIVVARKTIPHDEAIRRRPQPTSSMDEWLKILSAANA